MKSTVLMIGIVCLTGCTTSIKLTVPEAFKQQATMEHVNGARGNKMSFADVTTSKIKRGIHLSYPGWGRTRGFFLENLALNQLGIQKNETIGKEKAKFRYTLTNGKNSVDVYADEKAMTRNVEFETLNRDNLFNQFDVLQQYNYIFSAIIQFDTAQDGKNWELMMTNMYDRKAENDKNPFTVIRRGDNGVATNGTDTIFIKPISIKKTTLSNGKTGTLPFKLLSGYELSTPDGVIAIVDLIDRNIWFYNELNAAERLNVSAIATAIFARRVHDEKW